MPSMQRCKAVEGATGPGSIMLNSPEASQRASHLSEYLRRGSTLPQNIQNSPCWSPPES
jgi:hypothetical protein